MCVYFLIIKYPIECPTIYETDRCYPLFEQPLRMRLRAWRSLDPVPYARYSLSVIQLEKLCSENWNGEYVFILFSMYILNLSIGNLANGMHDCTWTNQLERYIPDLAAWVAELWEVESETCNNSESCAVVFLPSCG